MEGIGPPGDLSIKLTGQYDFVVTDELLHMMESERTVIVKWTFDDKKSKTNNGNHRLHKDFVRMLHKLLQTSIGTAVTGFTKAVISCSGIRTLFMLTYASMDTSGMIGHLFILKKMTT